MAKSIKSYIPNSVTMLNLISGCIAIYMSFRLHDQIGALNGAHWAIIAIAAAAIFDFLDGASARLLKTFSPLGKDLDSLSDLVSFGVAPAMLILNTMSDAGTAVPLCFATLMIPVCGALRLAKFNNDTEQTTVFRGLPIPANAIFWIGVYGWCERYAFPGAIPMIILIMLVSLAMTARFKMFSLKMKSFGLAENFLQYILITAAVVFIFFYGLSGLIWTVLLYFLLSIMKQRRL